jgi:dTDP-4-dehydrorhamnose reductase
MKILGTGLNGLVGTRVVELLSPEYEFESVSRSTGVDIQNLDSVQKAIKNSTAEVVFHFAAKANVDGCEEDKERGKEGEAWKINVLGTKNVVEACRESGKKLLYISTDFVFDGKKDGMYSEEDMPNPIDWYGQTKYEGEKIVQTLPGSIIARIAYPYRAIFEKKDFVRAIKARLEAGEAVKAVEDHAFCPTLIDDIAHAINILIKHNAEGIYHVVGSQTLTPYDAALIIADVFELDKSLISKTTREEYFKGKAPRPFNLSLKNDKIEAIGSDMSSFEHGLHEIKLQ